MKKRTYILYSLVAFVILLSCSKKDGKDILLKAEGLIQEHPDSALILLKSVENPDNLKKDQRADYYLLLADAKYKNEISLYGDSTLNEPVEYFSKTNDSKKTTLSYFLRNKAFFDFARGAGNPEQAMYDALEAKKYSQKSGDYLLGHIYIDIGDVYYTGDYYTDALDNYKKALDYFQDDTENLIIVFGKMGSAFNLLKMPDSALIYQIKSADLLIEKKDTSRNALNVLSALYKNIASSYRSLGNSEAQKDMLVKAYYYLPEKEGMDANVILHLITLAYFRLNESDSALFYAEKYIETEDENSREAAFRYNHWYNVNKAMGHYEGALQYLEAFTVITDRIYKEDLSNSVFEVQRKYDKAALENQYNKVLVQRLYLIIIIILVILILVAALWFFKFKIKSKENELLKAEQAIQTFQQLLSNQDNTNERLTDFLVQKLDLTRKVAQMNVVTTDNTKDFIKQYNKVFGKNLLDEMSWNNIYPIINDLYNGFVDKIQNEYSDLSEKDLQLCCFVRAGFRTEEIAVLLNYTQNTVRVKKSRLCRKMGFNDFESFLNHIRQ